MRIGLTNDDGVLAPGIARLAAEMRGAGHEVVIAAPPRDMSGAAASTGADLQKSPGIEITPVEVGGQVAYQVAGPPALCSLLLIRGAFGPPVEFMMSGINPGANLGISVLHSGTVGAVVTAGNFGVPGLAVSMDARADASDEVWQAAATLARVVVESTDWARPRHVASINVPGLPLDQIKGIRPTVLHHTPGFRSTGVETVEESASGVRLVRFKYEKLDEAVNVNTDVGAIRQGYASVSWLRSLSEVPAQDEADEALAALSVYGSGQWD